MGGVGREEGSSLRGILLKNRDSRNATASAPPRLRDLSWRNRVRARYAVAHRVPLPPRDAVPLDRRDLYKTLICRYGTRVHVNERPLSRVS